MNSERSLNLLGAQKEKLATPCLVLDLDRFEYNIAKMATHVANSKLSLRPHAKSHKCVEIARRHIAEGALGVCAATITEAEDMARGGITGILITSEMAGRQKIERLVRLTMKAPDTMSVVDNLAHAEQLNDAARERGVALNVLIDLDLGLHRTGVASVAEGMSLAEAVMKLTALRLKGVNAYSSMSAHVRGWADRREHSLKSMAMAAELFTRMRAAGMPVEILSGGSTGTYNIDTEIPEMTELQAGSYIFMDVDYSIIGGQDGNPVYDDFQSSLTVLTTLMSKNHKGIATVDAGFKAFATDCSAKPRLSEPDEVKYHFAGDEHGIIELSDSTAGVRIGQKLEFVVPHCDPTVNLYDYITCLRGGRVEAIWEIGRGYR